MDNKQETVGNAGQSNSKTGWEGVAAMADKMSENQTVAGVEQDYSESEVLTADNNVYKEIAKNALKNWNGLSEDEASKRVAEKSVDELENEVGAKSSIRSAATGIYWALDKRNLISHPADDPWEEFKTGILDLESAVLNEEKTGYTFEQLSKKMEEIEDKEDFVLDVLDVIHNDWVGQNVKKINDPSRLGKRYQQMPLELIGFNEAKSDLLFAEPILNAAGMEIDEAKLKKAYELFGDDKTLRFKALAKDEQAIKELNEWKSTPLFSPEGKDIPELADLCRSSAGYIGQNKVDYNNVEDKSNIVGLAIVPTEDEMPAHRKNLEDVMARDWAKFMATSEDIHHLVENEERPPRKGELAERYWVEVAKQVVNKINN